MYSLAYRFFGIQTYLFFVVKRSFSLVLVQCSKIGLLSLSQQSFLHLSCVPYLSTVNLFFLEFCDLFFIFFFLFGIFFRFFFCILFCLQFFFSWNIFFCFVFQKKEIITQEKLAITPFTFKTINVSWFSSCSCILKLQLLDALFFFRKLTNKIWNRISENVELTTLTLKTFSCVMIYKATKKKKASSLPTVKSWVHQLGKDAVLQLMNGVGYLLSKACKRGAAIDILSANPLGSFLNISAKVFLKM